MTETEDSVGLGAQYWMKENSLSSGYRNIAGSGSEDPDYVAFDLFNNCLHPVHPLGWFRGFHAYIDGRETDGHSSYFIVRGQKISFEELPSIRDIWWTFAERAEIRCRWPHGLSGRHTIRCVMDTSLVPNTRTVDTKGKWSVLRIELEYARRGRITPPARRPRYRKRILMPRSLFSVLLKKPRGQKVRRLKSGVSYEIMKALFPAISLFLG